VIEEQQQYRRDLSVQSHRHRGSSLQNEEIGRIIDELVILMKLTKPFNSDSEKLRAVKEALKGNS
jgi:hypothetical protein